MNKGMEEKSRRIIILIIRIKRQKEETKEINKITKVVPLEGEEEGEKYLS